MYVTFTLATTVKRRSPSIRFFYFRILFKQEYIDVQKICMATFNIVNYIIDNARLNWSQNPAKCTIRYVSVPSPCHMERKGTCIEN